MNIYVDIEGGEPIKTEFPDNTPPDIIAKTIRREYYYPDKYKDLKDKSPATILNVIPGLTEYSIPELAGIFKKGGASKEEASKLAVEVSTYQPPKPPEGHPSYTGYESPARQKRGDTIGIDLSPLGKSETEPESINTYIQDVFTNNPDLKQTFDSLPLIEREKLLEESIPGFSPLASQDKSKMIMDLSYPEREVGIPEYGRAFATGIKKGVARTVGEMENLFPSLPTHEMIEPTHEGGKLTFRQKGQTIGKYLAGEIRKIPTEPEGLKEGNKTVGEMVFEGMGDFAVEIPKYALSSSLASKVMTDAGKIKYVNELTGKMLNNFPSIEKYIPTIEKGIHNMLTFAGVGTFEGGKEGAEHGALMSIPFTVMDMPASRLVKYLGFPIMGAATAAISGGDEKEITSNALLFAFMSMLSPKEKLKLKAEAEIMPDVKIKDLPSIRMNLLESKIEPSGKPPKPPPPPPSIGGGMLPPDTSPKPQGQPIEYLPTVKELREKNLEKLKEITPQDEAKKYPPRINLLGEEPPVEGGEIPSPEPTKPQSKKQQKTLKEIQIINGEEVPVYEIKPLETVKPEVTQAGEGKPTAKEILENIKQQAISEGKNIISPETFKEEGKAVPDITEEDIKKIRVPAIYLKSEKIIRDKMPEKAAPKVIENILKKHGVSNDELKWIDIEGLIKDKKYITKEEVLRQINNNKVEVKEIQLEKPEDIFDRKYEIRRPTYEEIIDKGHGLSPSQAYEILNNGESWSIYDKVTGKFVDTVFTEEGSNKAKSIFIDTEMDLKDTTKYSRYTEPGGENYKELFFTLPNEKNKWNDGHADYKDIENPIVRIRVNDRANKEGKKILFIEEFQQPSLDEFSKMPKSIQERWKDIGAKNIIRYATENGYDSIAWTTGEMQSKRYNLSQYLDSLGWSKTPEGYTIVAYDKKGKRVISEENLPVNELSEIVGKEMANKIIKSEGGKATHGNFTGLDLEIGGEGLKSLYDEYLPNTFNKIGKKWGSLIKTEELDFGDKGNKEVSAIDITPEMKESVIEEGHSFFAGLPIDPEELKKQAKSYKDFRPVIIPKSFKEKTTPPTTPPTEPTPEQLRQPKAGMLSYGQKLPKYAPGTAINLERIDSPYILKKLIYDTAISEGLKKGEKKTWEQTRAEADSIGLDVDNALKDKPVDVSQEAWITAKRDVQVKSVLELDKIRNSYIEKFKSRTLTDADVAELSMAMHYHAAIESEVSGLATESGRALNAHKMLARAKEQGKVDVYKDIFKAFGGKEFNREIVELFMSIDPNDRLTVSAFLKELTVSHKLPILKRLDNIRRAFIVSQLITATRNAETQGAVFTLDTFASVMDKGLQKLIGKKDVSSPIAELGRFGFLFNRNKKITKEILNNHPDLYNELFNIYSGELPVNVQEKIRNIKKEGALDKILTDLEESAIVLNTPNRLQEYFYRRAAFISDLELKLNENKQTVLNKKGYEQLPFEEIPKMTLKDSVNHALELTLAKLPEKSTFGRQLIDIINHPKAAFLLTTPFPFPRFLVNSLTYTIDYNPTGFLKIALSEGQRKAFLRGELKQFSKAVIGTGLLLTAYQIRNSKYAGEKWHDIVINGKTYDLRPFNPLAQWLFWADVLKRYNNNTLDTFTSKDIAMGLFSTNLRAGSGLYVLDKIIDSLTPTGDPAKAMTKLKELGGEVIGGYSVPFRQLKDFVAQFDESESVINERRVRSPLLDPFMSNIPYAEKYLGTPPYRSPVRPGDIKREDPGVSQIIGVGGRTKTPVEKELDRLGFTSQEIFKPIGISEVDYKVRDAMGLAVENKVTDLINRNYYKNATDDIKGILLERELNKIESSAKNVIYKRLSPELRKEVNELKVKQKLTKREQRTLIKTINEESNK